jgi:hypothetical protein
MIFGNKFRKKLIELGYDAQSITGCDETEIEQIRVAQGVNKLPDIYKQYLLTAGQNTGGLYEGTDVTYKFVVNLKKWAKRLLIENGEEFVLPDDAFVFLMHHGYQFMYFLTDNTDEDPPVYHYIEGGDKIDKVYEHLSYFLTLFIAEDESPVAQQDFLEHL